jgi:hypothetical protein
VTSQAAALALEQAELVPTSAMSEFELEAGYSGLGVNPVAEPCACGTVIVASSYAPLDVIRAMRAHHKTRAHIAMFGPRLTLGSV